MTDQVKTKMKSVATAIVVAGVVGGVSMPVSAKKYRDSYDYQNHNRAAYDYAKVVDVQPIVESIKVNNPVEQCWDERVPLRRDYRRSHYRGEQSRHRSHTGEILGAIIGGAIGNQFGSGRGKKVATAAGAVLGASVAHDVKHQKRHRDRYARDRGYDRYEVVQRCEVRDNYSYQEQVVGYNVAYKYRGNVFHTEMDRDPGNKIKVRVTVDPV